MPAEQIAHLPPPPGLPLRRRVLAALAVTLGCFAAVLVASPLIGFLFSPLLRKSPRVWRPVGSLEKFSIGQTVAVSFLDATPLPWAGVSARTAAWLRRDSGDQFTAFSVNCTHLGCPVRWLQDADMFLCPCHGGVYYDDGTVAAGPPPRPLGRYPVRVRNGQVEVLTSPIPVT